jgi:hypothetical protein
VETRIIGCWDYALLAAHAAPAQPFTEEAYRCSFSVRSDRCSARCPAGAIPRRLLSRTLALQALLRASGTFRRRAVRGAGFAAAFVVVISDTPGAAVLAGRFPAIRAMLLS